MSYYPENGEPPPASAPPSHAPSQQKQADNEQYKPKPKYRGCNPCCCCSLRIGCIVIGVFQCLAIFSVIWMIAIGVSDENRATFNQGFKELASAQNASASLPSKSDLDMLKFCDDSFPWFFALGYLAIAVGGAVLLVAVFKSRVIFCLVHIGLTAGSFLFFLFAFFSCVLNTIMLIIIVIFMVPLMGWGAYFIVCSWFYRKQLREEMMDQKRSQFPTMYSQSQQQQQPQQSPHHQSMMMSDSNQMDQPVSGKSSGHKKHKGKSSVMPATEDENEKMMEKEQKGHQNTKTEKRKSHSQAHRKQSHHAKEAEEKDTTDDEGKVNRRKSHPHHAKRKSLRRKSRKSLDT